jgi:hypothetical protein
MASCCSPFATEWWRVREAADGPPERRGQSPPVEGRRQRQMTRAGRGGCVPGARRTPWRKGPRPSRDAFGATDTVFYIEGVRGTSSNDTTVGNAGNNQFRSMGQRHDRRN